MENNPINHSELLQAFKEAWYDCYLKLIPKSSENASEELKTYKAFMDWYTAGIMQNVPIFNIAFGHTVKSDATPNDLYKYNMDEMQDMYLKTGCEALQELITELESSNSEDKENE